MIRSSMTMFWKVEELEEADWRRSVLQNEYQVSNIASHVQRCRVYAYTHNIPATPDYINIIFGTVTTATEFSVKSLKGDEMVAGTVLQCFHAVITRQTCSYLTLTDIRAATWLWPKSPHVLRNTQMWWSLREILVTIQEDITREKTKKYYSHPSVQRLLRICSVFSFVQSLASI